nr:PREDICTED: cholesterol 7-alpha-monooxygenase-like [Latimeria chalumnae]|eukprot:XP_006003627.1 PREDICTED: cholesterol 7-alpha-monooxygenase-like [Latimeria chalumnae]
MTIGKFDWRKGEAPIESGWIPFFGVAIQFGADPLKFLNSRKKKYGSTFTCKIAGKYLTFITDPFSYSSVIRHGKSLDFQKFALETSRNAFGHVDFSDSKYGITYDEIHHIFLKTLQGSALGPLTQSMMANLHSVMLRDKTSSASIWTTEGLQAFVTRIIFEAGFLTLFGKNMKENTTDRLQSQQVAVQAALEDFKKFDMAFPALVAGVPISFLQGAKKAREALAERFLPMKMKQNECVSSLIEQRIKLFDSSPHLSEVTKARTHVIMLWAAQANTLPATFWSTYYLLRSPEALLAVRKEIDNMLYLTDQKYRDATQSISFTKEQLENMPTMGSVISEALRLSSASIMIRCATEDFTLTLDSGEKLAIRKGDRIALVPQLQHLDPEIYENPLEFQYDRFLDKTGKEKTTFYKNGKKLKHYLMPFGSGTSMCPGRFFAINEIKQFLSLLLCYYDIELLDRSAPPLPLDNSRAGLGILQPKHDVGIRYKLKNNTGQ